MSAPWRTEERNINLGTTQQLSTPFSQLIKEITNVTYRKTRWFRWFWQKFGIKGTEALTMENSKRQLSSKTPILLTKSKIMRTKICWQIARFQEPLRFKYWPIVLRKKKMTFNTISWWRSLFRSSIIYGIRGKGRTKESFCRIWLLLKMKIGYLYVLTLNKLL